jgi:hypothetical protein
MAEQTRAFTIVNSDPDTGVTVKFQETDILMEGLIRQVASMILQSKPTNDALIASESAEQFKERFDAAIQNIKSVSTSLANFTGPDGESLGHRESLKLIQDFINCANLVDRTVTIEVGTEELPTVLDVENIQHYWDAKLRPAGTWSYYVSTTFDQITCLNHEGFLLGQCKVSGLPPKTLIGVKVYQKNLDFLASYPLPKYYAA